MRPGGRIHARHGMFASRRYVGKQGIGVTIWGRLAVRRCHGYCDCLVSVICTRTSTKAVYQYSGGARALFCSQYVLMTNTDKNSVRVGRQRGGGERKSGERSGSTFHIIKEMFLHFCLYFLLVLALLKATDCRQPWPEPLRFPLLNEASTLRAT